MTNKTARKSPLDVCLSRDDEINSSVTIIQIGGFEMPRPAPEKPHIVYGKLYDDTLVFIPLEDAKTLAAIHKACSSSKTWGEFKRRMPPAEYENLIERMSTEWIPFDDWKEDCRGKNPLATDAKILKSYRELPAHVRQPLPGELFNSSSIPGFSDGDYPDWPAQRMLDWVPDEIQSEFGTIQNSVHNGNFLQFAAAQEKKIVEAFRRLGYRCTKREALVQRAEGHDN